jgi:hypothetical protein
MRSARARASACCVRARCGRVWVCVCVGAVLRRRAVMWSPAHTDAHNVHARTHTHTHAHTRTHT